MNRPVRELCEAWLQNKVNFEQVLKVAADSVPEFRTWYDEKGFGATYVDPQWIDGTNLPHPITQCKIIEEILELV